MKHQPIREWLTGCRCKGGVPILMRGAKQRGVQWACSPDERLVGNRVWAQSETCPHLNCEGERGGHIRGIRSGIGGSGRLCRCGCATQFPFCCIKRKTLRQRCQSVCVRRSATGGNWQDEIDSLRNCERLIGNRSRIKGYRRGCYRRNREGQRRGLSACVCGGICCVGGAGCGRGAAKSSRCGIKLELCRYRRERT